MIIEDVNRELQQLSVYDDSDEETYLAMLMQDQSNRMPQECGDQ